ncbi:hypothetical protein Q3G72_022340 [Acer saccharum]|nr:hypothetical protein Q3G72_022340 [Acer saccharum]
MGYLSCKAESAISVISTASSVGSHQTQSSKTAQKQERPIKIQQFDYSDLEAATNGFSEHKLLGKGSHGCVYKAVLRGRHVAVKKPSKNQEIGQEVDNEIEILSKIRSPRLVNLLGFSNDSKDRLLVVEFMCNGTLYDVLHSNNRPLNWGRRIRLALQIAKAVEILHSEKPAIIHRDIKSANVLIDRNFNARLGDFGLALSFGILLLEIISGRKAIDVGFSPPSIVDWAVPLIKKGKIVTVFDPRIAIPKDHIVRKQLAVIAARCVRSCRERRPTMKEIVEWLTGLSKLVPLHSWNGFNNPCLMVETMGRPVEVRKSQQDGIEGEILDGKLSRFARDSRRVYSDLGVRSNLMELMAGTDEEHESREQTNGVESDVKSSNRSFSSRFTGGRYVSKGRTQSRAHVNDKSSRSRLRRNLSIGDGSELFSRRDDMVFRSSFSSRATNDI